MEMLLDDYFNPEMTDMFRRFVEYKISRFCAEVGYFGLLIKNKSRCKRDLLFYFSLFTQTYFNTIPLRGGIVT